MIFEPTKECPCCNGDGWILQHFSYDDGCEGWIPQDCPDCLGVGRIDVQIENSSCSVCSGTGELTSGSCPACGGRGFLRYATPKPKRPTDGD